MLGKGDQLPIFELLDEEEHIISSEDLLGQSLVIYFYPKDETPGCTKEACAFRDSFDDFEALGARIIGISSDSPETHLEFKKSYNLPFTLLSDPQNTARKAFGVKGELFGLVPGRVTFVINADGKILSAFSSQLQINKHVDIALEVLNAEVEEPQKNVLVGY